MLPVLPESDIVAVLPEQIGCGVDAVPPTDVALTVMAAALVLTAVHD